MALDFEMNLFWAIVMVIGGLALLLKGADLLVDGAVSVAERLGVSPLVVGLTVVAMGTSAPEVATSITATIHGNSNMAIGNVFGSNIANLSLVAGFSAILCPIMIKRSVIRRELVVMLVVVGVVWMFLQDMIFGRMEGGLLLMMFCGLLVVSIVTALRGAKNRGEDLSEVAGHGHEKGRHADENISKNIAFIVFGLIGLAVGSELAVRGGVYIGEAAGLSEAVIGLTIIAVGTSLPELVTCVVAAIKKQHEISIGTLVGSNIFNALLALGCVGVFFRGSEFVSVETQLMELDYWVMVAVSVVFFVMAAVAKRISRWCGAALLCGYVVYMVYLLGFTRPG